MRCADTLSPRGLRERGAAIIVALLCVALAAGLAATVLADFGRSLESVAGRQDQAQARLLARAAVDWARNVLADDRRRTAVDHAKELWAVQVPATPVGEGSVGGEIIDRSGLFNLNNLAPDGQPDAAAAAQFARLLSACGAPGDATRLADAVAVWVGRRHRTDAAPSGPQTAAANGSLLDPAELRSVPGFDDSLVARLAPVVTALPAVTRINVNTAPAEVLSALVPGLEPAAARVLVAERERAWFKDLPDFTARLAPHLPDGSSAPASALDVQTRHFLVTGRASFGSATVRMEVLLDRRDVWPTIVWQRLL